MQPHTSPRVALYLIAKLSIVPLLLTLVVAGSIHPAVADSDILYAGDIASNTVRRFNAETGEAISGGTSSGVFVQSSSGGLVGPMGLLAKSGKLVVVNQNVDLPKPGEILRYKLNNGAVDGALVPSTDDHAPFAPRGIVIWQGTIYVADFNPGPLSGRLLAFDENSGKFLREFSPPAGFAYTFHPRGVVIGPNGLLYVSNFPNLVTGLGGQVLVFDPETLDFIGAFVVDAGGINQLNRPEGLVFGPDGNLYITSFQANATDTDSIRIYDGRSGVIKGKINLYASGAPRAPAQALVFGPDGKLFVPISASAPTLPGAFAGQVRRYDVADATDVSATTAPDFFEFVPVPSAGTSVLFYLTFGKTDPGTLAYSK
jgi:DNA-binding beta-propeller fold protein YncE